MRYFFVICFLTLQLHARVLSLSDESFASFFSGEMSTSAVKTSPFSDLINGSENYSSEYKNGYGGEFGFIYSTPYVGWRFSFEFLKPSKLSGVEGSNAGAVNYLVASDITSVAPKVGIELHLSKKSNSRLYLFGFYGSANLTMINTYTGLTVSPNADYEANFKASSSVYGGGIGWEWAFVDTTTLGLELGYRSLSFKEIKFSKDTNSLQGSKVTGDLYQDYLGQNKSLNLSSSYIALAFRFWL
ncbi:MAG: hypothetical protein HUU56_02615 [Bdellovibrionaceae bacterium]|nr:hypothetical protein [Pseudobdellovibrionaceae bacterium]